MSKENPLEITEEDRINAEKTMKEAARKAIRGMKAFAELITSLPDEFELDQK